MEERTPLFVNTTIPNEELFRSMVKTIHRNNKSYMIYGVVFSAIFLIIALCQLYGNLFMPDISDNWFVFFFFAVGGALIYTLCFNGYKLKAKQFKNQTPHPERLKATYSFYDDELEIENISSITTVPYRIISFPNEDENGFYLIMENDLVSLSRDGFSVGDDASFSEFASSHFQKKRHKNK